ncbi:hypothetical protein FH972_025659 [Carpinus fangiana]|uniref:Uncharacterized protein n=1 Tax=Carpinus fangiana TaxID=176857 RepID=A0A5N6L1M9_9ROSI|nr:hypothetical protein FH972_025659 [Carpinus fangiana]
MATHLPDHLTPPEQQRLFDPAEHKSSPTYTHLPDLSSLSLQEEDSDGTSSTGAVRAAQENMAVTAGTLMSSIHGYLSITVVFTCQKANNREGYDWPRSPPFGHSMTDEISPIFPDRPIRPLPKRKIRSRLSSEAADAISYPPVPSSSSPLFGSPQSQNETSSLHKGSESHILPRDSHDEHTCECGANHGSELDSEEEEGVTRTRSDGYESFENTNNKKKRKIPVSGAGMVLPSEISGSDIDHVSVDSAGISHVDEISSPISYASTGSGIGLSGAGRGRYARQQTRPGPERRPLGASTNALNAYSNGHTNKMKRDWTSTTTHIDHERAEKGIISAAMASAAHRSHNSPASKGQENVSLLQQEHQQASPQGKDFTFECKSNSSNKMGLTRRSASTNTVSGSINSAEDARGFTAQGTQTNPLNNTQNPVIANKRQDRSSNHANQAPPLQAPRRPRRPEQEYAAAARQRQMQQDINNYHHPPRKEDIWICEFCEYEAIWGRPPVALVRQYEVKDRKERKAAEERRRLLEKAKAKGRKNKKGTKGVKTTGVAQPSQPHPYDPQYDSAAPQEHDSQGEEFFDDDDYDAGDPPSGRSMHFEDDDVGYEDDTYSFPPAASGG